MAYCDVCGNFDDEHTDGEPEIRALEGYQPTLYYYWDGDFCTRITIGDASFLKLIVCARSVLISPTRNLKLIG